MLFEDIIKWIAFKIRKYSLQGIRSIHFDWKHELTNFILEKKHKHISFENNDVRHIRMRLFDVQREQQFSLYDFMNWNWIGWNFHGFFYTTFVSICQVFLDFLLEYSSTSDLINFLLFSFFHILFFYFNFVSFFHFNHFFSRGTLIVLREFISSPERVYSKLLSAFHPG